MCIFPSDQYRTLETKINKEIPVFNEEVLLKNYQIRISKIYFNKDYSEFLKKHKYLCVNGVSSEKDLVKAEARYPSEMK
jgi:hypothetical protein